MLERPVQVKVLAELGANEGVQGTRAGPASEEVHAFPAQGPGARPGEKEADPVLLDHEVHLVEECGHSLDLVDDDERRLRRQRFPNQRGIAGQTDEERLIEQVVGGTALELLADQGGLAGLPRTEEKAGSPIQDLSHVQMAGNGLRRHFQ